MNCGTVDGHPWPGSLLFSLPKPTKAVPSPNKHEPGLRGSDILKIALLLVKGKRRGSCFENFPVVTFRHLSVVAHTETMVSDAYGKSHDWPSLTALAELIRCGGVPFRGSPAFWGNKPQKA